MPLPTLVDQALRDLRRPVLVLSVDHVLADPPAADGVTLAELGLPLPQRGGWGSVLLVAPDTAALRRAVSVLPFLGRARGVVCVLRDRDTPVGLVPRATWPPMRQVVSRVGDDGGSVTRVEPSTGLPVAEVLLEIARQAGAPTTDGPAGVYVAQPAGVVPPPADGRLRVATTAAEAADPEAKVPADVWRGEQGTTEPHPVTGRALVAVDDEGIGPLDEAVLNPCGFRADVTGAVVDLPDVAEAGPALVAALREHRGVRVPSGAGRERLVAGLAMAGVPLVAEGLDARDRALLGDDVADALLAPVDLADPRARERHSVRLRRAALGRHGTRAWRSRLAAAAGLRGPADHAVVLVGDATPAKRADLLLARGYSGADAVGIAASDGRDGPAERWAADVSGGPLLVGRSLARRLGGHPSAAEVVAAGGTLYLTHALE